MTRFTDWIGTSSGPDGTEPRAKPGGRAPRRLALSAAVVLAVGLAVDAERRYSFQRQIDDRVSELLADARSEPQGRTRYTSTDVDGLPAPVARYFRTVLEDGQRPVRTVRLRQRGEFRLGDRDGAWRPFEAIQHVATRPPGFVWDAEIDVAPLLSVRVLNRYARGEGLLRAKLRSTIPVASAGPSPEMNEGELVRYLAEAVWYPTALLPAHGVEWEPIDDRTAKATLEHREVTASLVFHFDDRNEVDRVTTERYRQETDSTAPWIGRFRDYESQNGRRIPTRATVGWALPDGDLPYWRATIDAIEHDDVDDETR
ncbi:DUF6920 family protein [Natrinema salaciae]|uniref:Uncharacterized protein n=1 Tax=Natrinema salaciae TaxID=1186196 RepID=A0A1H9SPD8_9EURY|nr:DUF6544 family protein [Natrinema salaciae]SER86801.1 hypothetical protein SAMN04489841_4752 [Natrinema salaciae]